MTSVGYATLQIIPSAAGFSAALAGQTAAGSAAAGAAGGRRFGGGFMGTLKGSIAPIGGLLAAAGVGSFIATSIKSLQRIERINAQTEQAIKSMGGASGVTAEHVEALAGELENLTATEAESIQEGANLLLTFGNIRNEAGAGNDIFDQTTRLMTDMARAMGTDAKSGAIQLGKALNDPTKGITALTRVGVSFTEQQKETIKSLTASGDIMGAQKIILGELERQFGGSAEAYAQTTEGRVELAKHAIGTLGETITTGALPVIGKLSTVAANALNGLAERWPGITSRVSGFFKPVTDAARGVFDILFKGDFTGGLSAFGIEEDSAVVGYLFDLRDGALQFGQYLTSTVVPAAQRFGQQIAANVLPAVGRFGEFLTGTVVPALATFGGFIVREVVPAAVRFGQFIAANVLPVLQQLGAFLIGTVVPAVVSMAQTVASNVLPILQSLWAAFQANILPTLQKVFQVITGQVVPVLIRLAGVIVPVVKFLFNLVATILGAVIPVIINVAGPVIGFLINAIGNVIGWVASFIGWLLDLGTNIKGFVVAALARWEDFRDRAVLAFVLLRGRVEQAIAAVKAFVTARIAEIVGLALRIVAFKDRVVAGFTALRDQAIARVAGLVAEVRALPGKAIAALGNIASTLKQKGKDLIQGLIDGILAKIQGVKNAIGDVAQAIGDFLPGSPVKTGPLTKWNNGRAGKLLVGMLADGLSDPAAVDAAMRNLTGGIAMPDLGEAGTLDVGPSFRRGGRVLQPIQLTIDGRVVAEAVLDITEAMYAAEGV